MKKLLSALLVSAGLIAAGAAQASTPLVSASGTGFTPSAATHKVKPAKKAKKHKVKKTKAAAVQ
ncbi:acid-shock protein [Hydrogenophaga soli]